LAVVEAGDIEGFAAVAEGSREGNVDEGIAGVRSLEEASNVPHCSMLADGSRAKGNTASVIANANRKNSWESEGHFLRTGAYFIDGGGLYIGSRNALRSFGLSFLIGALPRTPLKGRLSLQNPVCRLCDNFIRTASGSEISPCYLLLLQ